MNHFCGFLLLLLPILTNGTFRIVGGDFTDITEVPYLASLYDGKRVCGGTIISKNAVLSAGHCFDLKNPEKDLFVTVGSNSFKKNDVTSYEPRKVYIHEEYSPNPIANDIAVVIVNSDFTFSEAVKTAILPKQNDFLAVGTEGKVSGWGSIHPASNKAIDKLKSAYIKVTDEEACEKILVKSFGVKPVKGTSFCAADESFENNICSGDSGGGFVTSDNTVHGIISWSVACGSKKYPSGFTRVAYYLDFIAKST